MRQYLNKWQEMLTFLEYLEETYPNRSDLFIDYQITTLKPLLEALIHNIQRLIRAQSGWLRGFDFSTFTRYQVFNDILPKAHAHFNACDNIIVAYTKLKAEKKDTAKARADFLRHLEDGYVLLQKDRRILFGLIDTLENDFAVSHELKCLSEGWASDTSIRFYYACLHGLNLLIASQDNIEMKEDKDYKNNDRILHAISITANIAGDLTRHQNDEALDMASSLNHRVKRLCEILMPVPVAFNSFLTSINVWVGWICSPLNEHYLFETRTKALLIGCLKRALAFQLVDDQLVFCRPEEVVQRHSANPE